MPKISVIVPVYNVEKYLDACIQSILSQSFSDFELILVDDESPDQCPALCDAWALKDSRIRVIHKKNGGLSDARNAGFEISIGEWITFIDSDDAIRPDFLSYLYQLAQTNRAEISVCSAISCPEDDSVPEEKNSNISEKTYATDEALSALFLYEINPNAWAKLYHRSVFASDIRYPKGRINEDLYTTYLLFSNASHIVVGTRRLYLYTVRASSIMGTCRTRIHPDKLNGNIIICEWILKNKPHLIQDHIKGCYMGFVSDAFKIASACAEKENKHFYKGYKTFAARYAELLPGHHKEKIFMQVVSTCPQLLHYRQKLLKRL